MPKRTYRKPTPKEAGRQLETTSPQQAASVVEAVVDDPYLAVSELAYKLGLQQPVVAALVERFRKRYAPVTEALRRTSGKELLERIEHNLIKALEFMGDDIKLAGASAKDLAIVAGILAEKRALLRGEPTAIVRNEERIALNDLLPALLHEAERRQMVIDLHPQEFGEQDGTNARVILDQDRQQARAAGRKIQS